MRRFASKTRRPKLREQSIGNANHRWQAQIFHSANYKYSFLLKFFLLKLLANDWGTAEF